MIKGFKLIIVLLITVLFQGTYITNVLGDESYYPTNSSPLNSVPPFSGETVYPEGPFFVEHNGVKFWLYNDGSGKLDLNLGPLLKQKMITSPPVVSPDFNHIVYTEVYDYAIGNQVVSKCFYLPVVMPKTHDDGSPITTEEYLNSYRIRSEQQNNYEVLTVGTPSFDKDTFRTLTIVDWDYDSTKVIIKEHIGRMNRGILGTIVWIYDVVNDKMFRVDTIREAIINHWLTKENLDLNQYVWDIDVLGWEKYSNNRFVVNAYAYPAKGKSIFLGCWSMDFNGKMAQLLSVDNEEWDVARNALIPERY